ncbi:hypothetical protein [Halostagnicola sp. A-GB9-2]|uniref:hypothetical protein n=1 Tax=Halostagnicola sp. A-GB9-2 TaxID=3048066 RepID=UPI0031F2E99D
MSAVRVIDIQTGDDIQPVEEGEIPATAPYAMQRYHDRPEVTEASLSDGWIHVGDIGRIDEDGYVYLLGRKSNVIITGGMNVYSTEVEEVLDKHSDIKEVAVMTLFRHAAVSGCIQQGVQTSQVSRTT